MSFLRGLFAPNIRKLDANNDIAGLIKALEHDKPDIRAEAASALGRIGRQEAVASLIRVLEASRMKPRLAAIRALGELQDDAAIEPLLKLLSHESQLVRNAARTALLRWKTESSSVMAVESIRKRRTAAWWGSVSQNEKSCDICTRMVTKGNGALVETNEIIASESYLDYAAVVRSQHPEPVAPGLGPLSQKLANQTADEVTLVLNRRDLEKTTRRWLVCDACLLKFDL